jgi:DNA replication ATP-dependent helicase Dna2
MTIIANSRKRWPITLFPTPASTDTAQILVVEDEKTKLLKSILLRQSWYDTRATTGSYVHVIGDFTATGHCAVDNAMNMLILHPDHLISTTTVADSFGCMRRAVLQDRVKATSEASPPLLYGSILHELFQEALKVNRWDIRFLKEALEQILPRHFETMAAVGLNINQVEEHLMSKIPEMQGWADIFIRATPSVRSLVMIVKYVTDIR